MTNVSSIWGSAPKSLREKYMETLRQVDWEAHKRDNCAAANWAAEEIERLRDLLWFVSGHQGITNTLRSHIRRQFESNK